MGSFDGRGTGDGVGAGTGAGVVTGTGAGVGAGTTSAVSSFKGVAWVGCSTGWDTGGDGEGLEGVPPVGGRDVKQVNKDWV